MGIADGVVFGKQGQGFTIADARREGLLLQANNVTVVGNVAIGSGTNGNYAFSIDDSGHTISDNVTLGNARAGFGVHGTRHTVSDNVASDNLLGFDISFSGQFTGNAVTSNTTHGVGVNVFDPSGLEIRRNAVIGNRNLGVLIFRLNGTITENNIFGNDNLENNCGLLNQTGTMLMAPNNFWGAPSGPGPDPADAVCNDINSTTIVDPVATKPFNIPVKSGF
jgi:nitrous oxidase accessory protein NosD